MDLNKAGVTVDLEVFVNAGVHCVKPEYIAAYLMDSPAPQPQQFYIPELQHLNKGWGNDNCKCQLIESYYVKYKYLGGSLCKCKVVSWKWRQNGGKDDTLLQMSVDWKLSGSSK